MMHWTGSLFKQMQLLELYLRWKLGSHSNPYKCRNHQILMHRLASPCSQNYHSRRQTIWRSHISILRNLKYHSLYMWPYSSNSMSQCPFVSKWRGFISPNFIFWKTDCTLPGSGKLAFPAFYWDCGLQKQLDNVLSWALHCISGKTRMSLFCRAL